MSDDTALSPLDADGIESAVEDALKALAAAADLDALKTARQWQNGEAIEVWCGPILVDTIKPTHKPSRLRVSFFR